MSMNAARHAREIVWNVEQIVAVEMLCAAQALDFRRVGLEFSTTTWQRDREGQIVRKTIEYEMKEGKKVNEAGLGVGTKPAYEAIRQEIEHLANDRTLYPDLEKIAKMVHRSEIVHAVEEALGTPLQGIAELMVKPD